MTLTQADVHRAIQEAKLDASQMPGMKDLDVRLCEIEMDSVLKAEKYEVDALESRIVALEAEVAALRARDTG